MYDKKTKGKEYYSNGKIEYEGEYFFDNKYDEKGYDKNGNAIYELNNGNGNAKEYHHNDKLEFEGEYLNGKRSQGKEYDYNDNLTFEGEYLN